MFIRICGSSHHGNGRTRSIRSSKVVKTDRNIGDSLLSVSSSVSSDNPFKGLVILFPTEVIRSVSSSDVPVMKFETPLIASTVFSLKLLICATISVGEKRKMYDWESIFTVMNRFIRY